MIRVPSRPVTKAEAEARRMTWYFTGKPCAKGHVSTRNVNSGACHACRRKEPQIVQVDSRTYAQRMRDKLKRELDLLS